MKDSDNLLAFINVLQKYLNSFDCAEMNNDLLYNIKTGRCAPEAVFDFLLSVKKKGQELRDKFIFDCLQDVRRFESVIKQNKIINFTNCNKKQKITFYHKVQKVCIQRDLFGRMLGISLEEATGYRKNVLVPDDSDAYFIMSFRWHGL